jgi:hypothetical protein
VSSMLDERHKACLNCGYRGANERGNAMAEQRHGRYYAQELMMDQDANIREQIQDALDAGERKEWHLVGVSDVLPERGVMLFWDTDLPGFARTSR